MILPRPCILIGAAFFLLFARGYNILEGLQQYWDLIWLLETLWLPHVRVELGNRYMGLDAQQVMSIGSCRVPCG